MDYIALKSFIDGLTKEQLSNLSLDDLEVIKQYKDKLTFNKLLYIQPYPYQIKFMNASKHYKQRYSRSGNRTGKTFGAAVEVAQHLTGLYQPYFEGEKILDSGHTFWCIGIDADSTAKVMQKELLGTADIRLTEEIGKGSIPKDCIDLDNMVKDGYKANIVRIKHTDGGYNTLYFYAASNDQGKLMGQAVKFVWYDEEPKHNSLEIYSQCITRLATTNGHMLFTATPEMGMTALNQLYVDDKSGKLYLQSVSMYEAPHLTLEVIEELKSGWPEWQWDMRLKGLPVLGSGSVFPLPDSSIMCDPLTPLPHWPVCAGVDWGSTVDPTVITYGTYDVDNDIYYLYDEKVLDKPFGEEEDRSPASVAVAIRNTLTPNIPIIIPHDSGLKSNEQGKGAQLVNTGVNVDRTQFSNPSHLCVDIQGTKQRSNSVEVGLEEMRRLMREGKLKISSKCTSWFSEKNKYFYDKGKPIDKFNHTIDSSRYCIMSLVGNKGTPFGQCQNRYEDFNNGFDYSPSGFSLYEDR